MLAHTLFHLHLNKGKVKYNFIAFVVLSNMYRALGKCKKEHRYFLGCILLLHWWILIHLEKGHATQKLHTLAENTLKDLNDWLLGKFREHEDKRKMALDFSNLRDEDMECMFDRYISKDVIVRGCRQLVIPLPCIQGIFHYAPFRTIIQFARKQITPLEGYYRVYVYDIWDD